MNFLKGRLTYGLAVIAILWGVVGLVAGWGESEANLGIVWMGLAAFGIRRAIN